MARTCACVLQLFLSFLPCEHFSIKGFEYPIEVFHFVQISQKQLDLINIMTYVSGATLRFRRLLLVIKQTAFEEYSQV